MRLLRCRKLEPAIAATMHAATRKSRRLRGDAGGKVPVLVLVLCSLAGLLSGLVASAAPTAELVTLRGQVVDPRGVPVSDATIVLEELPAQAVSGRDGQFHLNRIPAGRYTARVTHVRFAPVSIVVQATADYDQISVVRFGEETPFLMGETVITATRTPRLLENTPLPVTVITRQAIEAYQATNIAPLLDQVPGVTQMPNGFARSSVSIHGLPEQYALLLVNGQRQYGRHADAKDLEHIPTDAIERIEVVKGPSSVLYGSDAVAGVINVITRDGMPAPMLNLSAMGGSHNTYSLRGNSGGSLLGWNHFLAASWNKSGFMGEGYGFSNTNLRLNSNTIWQHVFRFQIEMGYFEEASEDMPATETYAGGNYLDDEIFDVRASLTWDASQNSRWQAAVGYYDQYRRDARPGNAPRFWERKNYLVDIQNTWQAGGHTLTSGIEMRLDNIDYTLMDASENQALLSVYAQDEWEWSEKLNLVAAARMERHDRWGTVVVPRLGVSMHPSPSTTVRLSGGTSFRAPALTDLYESEYFHPWSGGFWLGGNPDLDPEKSFGLNLDVEYRGRAAAVSGGLFFNRLTDRFSQSDTGRMIDDRPVRQLVNSDQAESWGAEFRLRYIPAVGLVTTVAYTYLHTEDKATGLVFDYSPTHTFNTGLEWQPSGLGLTLGMRGKYMNKRYANAVRGNELDGTLVLDFNIEQELAGGVSLFGAVENALNQQIYWESRYFSDDYRRIRSGLRYRL